MDSREKEGMSFLPFMFCVIIFVSWTVYVLTVGVFSILTKHYLYKYKANKKPNWEQNSLRTQLRIGE
jgi:uncharacterized membrane protein SpoIIM required for sporulation